MPPGLEDFDFDDLLMGGTGETKTEHKCKIFGPLKDGDAEILDK
jgi:predicted ATPase